MSARLRDLLDDLAAGARGYGDPDLAVATARRRVAVRRVAVPLAAAAAVAILAAVLASPAVRDRINGGPEIGTTPDVRPDYPERVSPPGRVDPLPDAPLTGNAAFVYAPCPRDCDPYLVLVDGTHYRLPRPDIGPPVYGYSVSPDGRWLGRPTAAGYELRDLRGGATAIPDSGPGVTEAWVWAPDSRSVLLARHHDGAVDHYLLVGLAEGLPSQRVEPPAATVVAVRNNGDLVGWISGGEPNQLPVLGLIPRGQSTVAEELPVRLPPNASGDLLREGERFQMDALYLSPEGDSGILVVVAPAGGTDQWPTGVLGLELSDGGYVSGRNEMPASTGAGPAHWHVWEVANTRPGGVVLLHWHAGSTEIVVLNEVNGERVVATVLPTESQVRVRGDGRY